MFDKILVPVDVPVDGSGASSRAVHVAADLASRYGAEVIVLHVRKHEYLYGVDAAPEKLDEAVDLVEYHVRSMKDRGPERSRRGRIRTVRTHRSDNPRCRRRREHRPHRDRDARPV